MKNAKLKVTAFLSFLILMYSIQPVLAATQYSVRPGAQFRWDATKYYFQDNDPGIDLEYTLSYYLEFDFTNWAGFSGSEYPNGTLNINGTIIDGWISHKWYCGDTGGQAWASYILDVGSAAYPIDVYLVCDTEIEDYTKPQMQNLDTNSWITFNEPSTNNFTLTGTDVNGANTIIYTANIEFNSDKVLKYVFDEDIRKTSGITKIINRYIWTLTYTPGAAPGNGSSIPGFQLIFIIGAMTVGFIFILKKYKFLRTR